jgi:Uma2 family endonuclease
MARPSTSRSPISIEDYLAFEESAFDRHEYVSGEVYAMSGATPRHNLICANILTRLREPARKKGCRVYMEAVKLRAASDIIYYPDIIVSCVRAKDDELVIANPSFIVEVASPSTRTIDRREKLATYRRIASLQAYLMVEQKRRQTVLFSREGVDEWQRLELVDSGDVALPFLDCVLTLDEIYDDIELPPMRVGEETDDEYDVDPEDEE